MSIVRFCLPKSLFAKLFNRTDAAIKKKWKDTLVLINGAGDSVGQQVALMMAKYGVRIIACDTDKVANARTVRMVQSAGGKAHAYTCDITDWASVQNMANAIKNEHGSVKILINNTGLLNCLLLYENTPSSIESTFGINIKSHIWMCKAFLPDLKNNNEKDSHLVTIASAAGLQGMPGLTSYCLTQSAVIGLHEAITAELNFLNDNNNVKTTIVLPYFVNTTALARNHRLSMMSPPPPPPPPPPLGLTNTMMSSSSLSSSFLSPHSVAERTVAAIVHNEDYVLIPRSFTALFILKQVMPTNAFRYVLKAFGFDCILYNDVVGYWTRNRRHTYGMNWWY